MANLTVTKENFEDLILNIGKPVLLDFHTPWCESCRKLDPIVEQIGEEQEDILFGKVDVDEQPELAREFHVVSVPTLVMFRGGEVTAKAVGLRSREEILNLIRQ